MICVKIQGGQGNQMFQYAVGRYLSLKNNCELGYELSYFLGEKNRKYVLDIYSTVGVPVKKWWVLIYEKYKFLTSIMTIFFPIYKDRVPDFCDEIMTLNSKRAYLVGYWIKVSYFDSIKDILKNDFKLKKDLSKNATDWVTRIRESKCPTVSIHVRRGDYVSCLQNKGIYREMTIDYYQKCVAALEEKFGKLSIFVFSNDIKWAEKNLLFGNSDVFYVTGTDEDHGYEDMYMMWECEHHIIANSTFSWWGAYLAKKKGLTYAPRYWFNMESHKDYIEKLYPDDWVVVD